MSNTNQVNAFIAAVGNNPHSLSLFKWIAYTNGSRFALRVDSIDNLFGDNLEARAAVPAADVQTIVAIAKEACQIIGSIDKSVCPFVNGM